jgi:hypothetical protein
LRDNIPIEACRQTVDNPVYATAQETSKRNRTPQDVAASTAEDRRDNLLEARTKSKESGKGDLTSRKGRREKEATSRRTSLTSADDD